MNELIQITPRKIGEETINAIWLQKRLQESNQH